MPGVAAGSAASEAQTAGQSMRASAGPEVLVLHVGMRREGAVVVVQVELGDARPSNSMAAPTPESCGAPLDGLGEVEVAEVEADADRIEVAGLEDVEQVLRRGDFVLHVLQQQAHAERRRRRP